MDLIVANAYKIKHIPGRKNDLIDSEWLAELCLNGMIEPSRIFPKDDREFRRLTRAELGNRIGTGLPYLRRLMSRLGPFHDLLSKRFNESKMDGSKFA